MQPTPKFSINQTLYYREDNIVKSGKCMFVRFMKAKDHTPDSISLSGIEYFINGKWRYEESIIVDHDDLIQS